MATSGRSEKSFLRRILHWGPILALSVTAEISISSLVCLMQWWPPFEGDFWALANLSVFLLWSFLSVSNLLQAAYLGPGYVPLEWKPQDPSDESKLQFCELCNGFKAPRSHHCRKCNRCVMKMDHHCPWINNCTGHFNHASFTKFLFWSVCGCVHAVVILGCSIYWALFRVWYMFHGTGSEPFVFLGLYGLLGALFGFGLAIGVIIAVGFLLLVQLKSILRNKTGIEEYINDKAQWHRKMQKEIEEEGAEIPFSHRLSPFVYPYDLGWRIAKGQSYLVTRYAKHWLYGQLILNPDIGGKTVNPFRGWFPRSYAIEFHESEENGTSKEKDKDQ